MNRRICAGCTAAAVSLLGLSSCGLFSGEEPGPARVDDLVGWIERVHVESERSRETVHNAAGALRAITAQDFKGDAVASYKEFVRLIEQSERQATQLRSNIGPMKEAAGPLFERWNAELLSFTSTGLRQRSQSRLEITRGKFQALVAAAEPAQAAYDAFNLGLRDIALFLSHDFNPHAMSAIQDDVRSLTNMAAELDSRFSSTLTAASEYVQAAALPAATAGPPVATPPGGSQFVGPPSPSSQTRNQR